MFSKPTEHKTSPAHACTEKVRGDVKKTLKPETLSPKPLVATLWESEDSFMKELP